MLGIIGGTSLLFARLPPLEKQTVATPYGKAEVHTGAFALLLRHQHNLPPHRINYPACLAALAILGVDTIVAFGSAGSLKPGIPPGSIVIPSDYLSVTDIPSIHECTIDHIRPELDADLVRTLGNWSRRPGRAASTPRPGDRGSRRSPRSKRSQRSRISSG
jgi:Purine nucleoside phosphorylase